jgi:hypothetical protein
MHRKAQENSCKNFGFAPEARKFIVWLILEVPLIVLQYYKPSFSIYIYIYLHKGLYIEKDIILQI